MPATAQPSTVAAFRETMVALRRKELTYARALGIGVGIFLLLWAPLGLARWAGTARQWGRIEAAADVVFGVLLLLPYGRIKSTRVWRRLLALLAVAAFLFIFVLVFDVLFIAKLLVENQSPADSAAPPGKALYAYGNDAGPQPKLPFPILGCAVVFLGLLQVPVVYFCRYPERMD